MCIVRRGFIMACLFTLAGALFHACGKRAEPQPPANTADREKEAREVFKRAFLSPDEWSAEDGPAPDAKTQPGRFDEAMLARIQRGMTPEEVRAITGVEGTPSGGDGAAIVVLRYEDAGGNNFTARFDNGALRTHSSLRAPRAPGETAPAPEAPPPPVAAGDRPLAEIAPGVFIPLERAVNASTGQPLGTDRAPRPAAAPNTSGGSTPPAANGPKASTGPNIVIAGAARRAREAATGEEARSYRPRASLPAFTRSLREGSFEIRFLNPDKADVAVGLRQEKLGLDLAVKPGGQASLKVDRGVYQLFFVRQSEPYTLYEAKPITIDGFQTTDLEVRLDPKNVEVRLIDYGQPE